MSEYFFCCSKCFDALCLVSTNAARIWMDLCVIRVQSGDHFDVHALDFPELSCLERLGYIVTTDYPNKIKVRMNGYMVTDDGQDFFCIKDDEHDEDL